jgi:hypothetical protein
MTYWIPDSPRRDPIFEDPGQMYERCKEYFDYVRDTPLYEEKVFQHQGVIVRGEVTKPRAMTIKGMCIYLGFSRETWSLYRKREGFAEVCEMVEDIIYTQKFELAAADLLNVNLIARDLGLREKQDVNHTSEDGTMTPTRIELVAPHVNRTD